ncbi:MAG: 1-acyl-sn-glycerol-3-phosphate acyltransferase [Gammaproteobacteria bacterium]|nr:1-acyl-sn-glycerol-3-phosphate acyltransferase [Gammaproteobacteria bacterium]MDH5728640.1 1-acyl-sn-glycerol-3-phosphate acyltransferase [Gammaproteobacteria bacterium]
MQWIRSLIYFVFMVLTAIGFGLLSVVLWPLPFKWRYGVISQWARMNIPMLKVICNLNYEVEGRENIPEQASVILCKHQSTWETMALQCIFPPQIWVLKKELLKIPFFGWGLACLDPIAINRKLKKKAMEQVMEQGQQRLDSGRWVVIFPEGTRIPAGKKGKYQLGGARLAKHAGHLVVPVMHNAGEYWPKKGFLKTPGTIKVVIGKPIDPTNLTPDEIMRQTEEFIESNMKKHSTLDGVYS